MNKLNKVLNIIFIVVVGLFIIGLCVDFAFLNYRPNETKAFNDTLIAYINQPLPIVGVSLIVVGKLVLGVLARTSWGKAQIVKVNEKVDLAKQTIESEIKSLEDKKSALKCELDTLKGQLEQYQVAILDILEQIPNKKVQNKVKELKDEEREETING